MSGLSRQETIWLVEIEAYTGSGVETLRYSDIGYNTKPTDTPSNTHYEARVEDPGTFSVSMFAGGATGGVSEVGYGAVVLSNPDGDLDALRGYGFGRTITIKSLEGFQPSAAAYSTATTRFTGIVTHIEADFDLIRVYIRDELALLDRPFLEGRFAGTSTGATGIEGNTNVEGLDKLGAFGAGLRNVTPVLANASNEIYAFGHTKAGATKALTTVAAVRNAGATYTLSGTNRTNLAAMEATAPTAAQADTCTSESLIRLNGSVTGAITVDFSVVADSAATAGQVVDAILTEHGYTLETGTVTALDAKNSAVIAVLASQGESILQMCIRALESIGAYIIPSGTPGEYKLGRFEAPTGTAALDIVERMILQDDGYQIELLATDDADTGIPAYRVTASYDRNWTPQQPGELAGSVSQDNRAAFKEEWRRVVAEDTAIKTTHPEAPEIEITTHLRDESAASTEATRRLTFLKSDKTRLRVPLAATEAEGVDVGDKVTLTMPRFGLDSGKDFLVLGREDRFGEDTVILDIINSSAW